MVQSATSIKVIARTSKRLVFYEAPRLPSSITFLVSGLLCTLMLLFLRGRIASTAGALSILVPVLLSIGINRMLGTLTVFDLDAGAIFVSRTLGGMTLFRRKFRMDSAVRVFNDRRPYVRPTIQNPKLQLSSGRQINLAQWCPSEFDFEAETDAANRMLRAWKQAQASAVGQAVKSYSELFGDAAPQAWSIEGLDAAVNQGRLRSGRLLKLSSLGLILGIGLLITIDRVVDGLGLIPLVVVCLICLMGTIYSGAALLVDTLLTARKLPGTDTSYRPPNPRSGRRRSPST
jgi:hypothetical protein